MCWAEGTCVQPPTNLHAESLSFFGKQHLAAVVTLVAGELSMSSVTLLGKILRSPLDFTLVPFPFAGFALCSFSLMSLCFSHVSQLNLSSLGDPRHNTT